MDKLKMHSPDRTQEHIARLRELFPGCVTEAQGEDGRVRLAVDFDLLRQELTGTLVEGPQERYQLNWPGKREALLTANAAIAKALRPCREDSVDFDSSRNLFIEGDNLDALKLLQEAYLSRIKLIYFDPPYNTGGDFIYADDFAADTQEFLIRSNLVDDCGNRLTTNSKANGRFHSNWLSMMFSRLRLARTLLTEDGVLVVSIDENEHANLVTVGSEIFGKDGYVGEIVLKNSSRNDQQYISMQHEYIVFFVKDRSHNNGNWIERKGGLEQIYSAFADFRKVHGNDWDAIHAAAKEWYKKFPPSDPIYASKHYTRMDERGIYFADNISGPNDGQYVYDIDHPITGAPCKRPARGWVSPRASMLDKIRGNRIHFGPDHTTVPNLKTYLKDTENQSLTSIRYVDGRAASKRLAALFGEKVFTNPKDEFLLKEIYKALGVRNGDIVLDAFSGSGSALQAVWELNLSEGIQAQFIGIQVAEDLAASLKTAKGAAKQITTNAINMLSQMGKDTNVAELCKQRLRLAGERKRSSLQSLDVGFRCLKIGDTNLSEVYYAPDLFTQTALEGFTDNIKPDRTAEDLLFQVMLDWGVDLSLPITRQTIQGREVLFVDGNALAACFDAAGRIDEDFVKELATHKPLRAVFRDAGFADSAAKINVEQIFKLLSPATEVKCL